MGHSGIIVSKKHTSKMRWSRHIQATLHSPGVLDPFMALGPLGCCRCWNNLLACFGKATETDPCSMLFARQWVENSIRDFLRKILGIVRKMNRYACGHNLSRVPTHKYYQAFIDTFAYAFKHLMFFFHLCMYMFMYECGYVCLYDLHNQGFQDLCFCSRYLLFRK